MIVNTVMDFWMKAYLASLQGSRANGAISGHHDSAIFSGRAIHDADEAVQSLLSAVKDGRFNEK